MDCYITNCYTSVSCNRTPESVDWAKDSRICFGACNSVAIFDNNYKGSCKIVKTLCQHTSRINAVRCVRNFNDSTRTDVFISGSNDKTAIVWTLNEGNVTNTSKLEGHIGAVTIVDGIHLSESRGLLVATASTDSTVKLWHQKDLNADFVLVQSIKFGTGFCLTLKLCVLPSSNSILLACAADDAKIHIFAESMMDNELTFAKVDTLIGHEDWIRGLDFTLDDNNDLLLASASQDTYVRLWRISLHSGNLVKKSISSLGPDEDIQYEEKIFSVETTKSEQKHYAISLEAVLSGHEGWVYGVNWHPKIYNENGKLIQPLKLLSSSMDKTMIIWAPESESGVWLETVRVGEVGGNTLGFYGSRFSPDGTSILGHGYQGSFHIWNLEKETNTWSPAVTVSGHFAEVTDLSWEPAGEFLLSVGFDQTTRLHAPWKRGDEHEDTWHELARPQVHGYDMTCLAVLSRYRFASGAEEKVIRAFQAPTNFVDNFRNICKVEKDAEGDYILNSTTKGASVPSLGLSNKAVYDSDEIPTKDKHVKDEYPENYFVPLHLSEPPTEENLMQNTLWPEVHKLYGHGYELYALAASPDGKYLASSCKATNLEHASVILWDATTWKQLQNLSSHQLTVTQITFSPDNQHLLTVSRDRRWTLFSKINGKFELVATTDKKTGIHTRIIWCCAWSHDSKYFATGSREGKIVLWGVLSTAESDSPLGQYGAVIQPLEILGQSITALAMSSNTLDDGSLVIAAGVENGLIYLYKCLVSDTQTPWKQLAVLDKQQAHHLTVKRLAFRPFSDSRTFLELASCGEDHVVKIHNINIK